MLRVKISRAVGITIGLLTFAGTHTIEATMWNVWFGGVHRPWFLNSGSALAFTVLCLFAVSLIAGRFRISGPMIAGGAFIAMALIMFLREGGAGDIFPLVLVAGALFIAAAALLGGWLGSEIGLWLSPRG
jgi:hypothetical protein